MDVTRRSEQETVRGSVWDGLMPTVVLALCFLAGGAAGCIASAAAEDGAAYMLSSYLQTYLALFAEEELVTPGVWAVLWEMCRWPILALVLGSTALGAVAIPAVFCVRGFLLAYSISAFVRVFGGKGIVGALTIFGVSALLGVPVLFGVGSVTFPSALGQAVSAFGERLTGPGLRAQILRLAPCGVMMALAVVIQWSLIPQLLSMVSAFLIMS
jgi:hypothetical protein